MVVASTQLRHVIVTAVSSRRGEVPGRRIVSVVGWSVTDSKVHSVMTEERCSTGGEAQLTTRLVYPRVHMYLV